ncbi:hypothetical protein [Hymenobacter glacieicola]|uniref:Uncharacterized protein n=1 Tax=Hymenobacter glacieicola TaxID=1562124 RepID=A0ABQ1X6L7_9BACT|nr:hypothetical protein [Hymenobacter glacieicola]GGG61203.1 hypothetical protein GCM10011378_41510 [Hymenobacter glacieicola]
MKTDDLKAAALKIEPDILRSELATAILLAAKYDEVMGLPEGSKVMSNAPGALAYCCEQGWLQKRDSMGVVEIWRCSKPGQWATIPSKPRELDKAALLARTRKQEASHVLAGNTLDAEQKKTGRSKKKQPVAVPQGELFV